MKLFAKGKGGAGPAPQAPSYQPIDRRGLLSLLDQVVNGAQSGVLELREPKGTWTYAFAGGALTHASGGRVRGARQAFDLLWEFQSGEFLFTPGTNPSLAGNLYIDKNRLLDLLRRSQAVLQGPASPYIPPDQQRPIAPVQRPYSPPSPGQLPPAWQPPNGQPGQAPAPAWGNGGAPPAPAGYPQPYPQAPYGQNPAAPGAQPYPPQQYPPQPYPPQAYPPQAYPPQPYPPQAYPPQSYPQPYPSAPQPPVFPGPFPAQPAPQPPQPEPQPTVQAPSPRPAAPARSVTPPTFSVPPMAIPKRKEPAPVYQPPVAPASAVPPVPDVMKPAQPPAKKDDMQSLRASLVGEAPPAGKAPSAAGWGVRTSEGTVTPAPAAAKNPKKAGKSQDKPKRGKSKLNAAITVQLIKFLLWACERKYSPDDHWNLKDAFEVSTMELREQFVGAFSQNFKSGTKSNNADDDELDQMAAGRMRGRGRKR